jgi:hypothetical protein
LFVCLWRACIVCPFGNHTVAACVKPALLHLMF